MTDLAQSHTWFIHFWGISMQIIRNHNLNLAFPATLPQTSADQPDTAQPTVAAGAPTAPPPILTATVAPPAQSPGVIYTGSGNTGMPDLGADVDYPDLDNMSLENQLEFGRNKGVFTKITLSKDGVLVSKPHGGFNAKSAGFAASAAATIKDFEEGIASLKQHTSEANDKSSSAMLGRFKSLQQLTARLNVFA